MQKEENKLIINIIKGVLYIAPFFLGWYGIYQLGEGDWLECAYKSVQLYLMEYSVETKPINLALTIAKVAAPLVTAAFLVSFLYSMVENLQIWWRLKKKDVVVFHGDSANIDLVQKKLGDRAIVSERPKVFQAEKHVLMFNEDVDMYHFIDKNGAELLHEKNKTVFLCSEKILRGCYESSNIVVCNVAENCARTYWQQYPIRMRNGENGPEFVDEKILLIGFDNYAQRLLTQAILKNVVSDSSAIEYHVCGRFSNSEVSVENDEYASYLDTHMMLHKAVNVKKVSADGTERDYRPRETICENYDTVYFHEASWQRVMGRGVEFDRIIICKDLDAENMEILNELKTFFVVDTCHIKYTDKKILEQLWDCEKDNIYTFGVNVELYDPDVILKETLFRQAMMIHGRYYAKYVCQGIIHGEYCDNQVTEELFDKEGNILINEDTGKQSKTVKEIKCLGKCVDCPKLKKDWAAQNNFIRYSNVAQADHIPEKIRILLGPDVSMDTENVNKMIVKAYEALKPLNDPLLETEQEKKQKMAKLHALWKIEHIRWDRYHFMNNWDYAEQRDKKRRKHHLLVRYEELSLEEQRKDEDTYLSLGEILASENQ